MSVWYVATTGSDSNSGTSGSPFLTVGHAVSVASSGDTVAIQTGTYSISATISVPSTLNLTFVGYQTTIYDNGTPPLLTTSVNSTILFQIGGNQTFQNINMSNTAVTRDTGIYAYQVPYLTLNKCTLDGFTRGLDGQATSGYDFRSLSIIDTVIKNCTTVGVINFASAFVKDSYFLGNVIGFQNNGSNAATSITLTFINSVFASNVTGISLLDYPFWLRMYNCAVAFNTGDGIVASGSVTEEGINLILVNNIFYSNGGWGIHLPTTLAVAPYIDYFYALDNAYGSNTSGNYSGFTGVGDIALTATPFFSPISNDFKLNSNAGGGALCKAAGFPGISPFGTGYIDVGPLQSQVPAPPPAETSAIVYVEVG
jgi:pectate lyase-like protein